MFLQFFLTFLKVKSNFEHFEKKEEAHRLCITKIRDCKRCGYLNV